MKTTRIIVILLALPLYLALPTFVAAAELPGFPPDPEGITVIDRAFESIPTDQAQILIYAILYNRGPQGMVDIYRGSDGARGVSWKKVYSWKVKMDDDVISFTSPCILNILVHKDEAVNFSINLSPHYYEGRVTLYLRYILKTGTFEPGWVD